MGCFLLAGRRVFWMISSASFRNCKMRALQILWLRLSLCSLMILRISSKTWHVVCKLFFSLSYSLVGLFNFRLIMNNMIDALVFWLVVQRTSASWFQTNRCSCSSVQGKQCQVTILDFFSRLNYTKIPEISWDYIKISCFFF